MLDINPEIVCNIIARAHQFHAKEEVVIPEAPLAPSDSWARQALADHADDPVYTELKSLIDDLEPDQQVQLVALMWLGRGVYDVEEWGEAIEEATAAWTRHTADYLITTPLVADYLEEGLALLGYSCE